MKQIICLLLSALYLCSQSTTGQLLIKKPLPVMPVNSKTVERQPANAVNPVVNGVLACPTSTTLYVDSSKGSSGNGSSWQQAYKELREAFATAAQCPSITTILVAKGTYKPTAGFNRDSSFVIVRGGLKIYGGYAPGGASRNISNYPTILSGNIGNQDSSDNSYHVMLIATLGSSADSLVVDGFRITAGNANGSGFNYYDVVGVARSSGGGVLFTLNNGAGRKIVMRNCIFSANNADFGAGVYNEQSSSAFISCTFVNNKANTAGGGICNIFNSSPSVTNCIFFANNALFGGGVMNYDDSPVFYNCTLSANTAATSGGGIYNSTTTSLIANCIIWGNNTGIGGSQNTVTYSDVQGGYAGANNINADPRFVNAADPDGVDNTFGTNDDGLKLLPSSPTINKGRNDSIPSGITTDIAGAARIQQGIVDMGAYESPYPTSPVLLSINDVAKVEGNSGTTLFTFTVSLSSPALAGGVSFGIATADSTAIAPSDYVARPLSTQTIAQGSSTYSFDVIVKGDLLIEPTEYFLVKITGVTGTNAYASDSVGVGTITNDDACPASAKLYVDSSRSNSGNGASWETAYKELREALTIAAQCNIVDSILVAKGTYKPTDDANRDSAFAILQGGLKLYGGYPSGGGARNITANPTVLSGDIGTQNDSTDNSYHVMVIAGLGSSADSVVVDGFTVTRGRANGNNTVKQYNGAPVQRDEGSSLYLHTNNGAGGRIAVRNCIFTRNSASSYGAGFYNQLSSPTISNCVFSFNTVTTYGGAGMFNVNQSSPKITNCLFAGNSTTNGGGMYNNTSSPVITNCTFSANTASGNGGAISNINSSSPVIANCIIWGNTGGGIFNNSSTPAVSYSDVQGTSAYPGAGNIFADPRFVDSADPDGADNRFATSDDGLRLQSNSPAINKGRNDAIATGITTDITGAQRIQEGIVDMGAYESPYPTPVFLSINDVAKAEGNAGNTLFTFTVRLSASAPAGGVNFTIATADSTATAPGDYTARLLAASIAAGDSLYSFDVSVKGDTIFEPTEFFLVKVTGISGTGVFVTDSAAVGTITNDDSDPCANDQTPPVITPKNITVYLNAAGQASIQPFDVIQSVTDNCGVDSASISISRSSFSCQDLGDSTTAPVTHLAYVASTNTGVQAYGGELGMEFTVNRRITVNQLGAFDHQSNGISGAVSGGIRVAIFNKATQQIVPGLDAIVAGMADGFASNHRLKNITPIQLLPGSYVVVAKGYNANELNGNSGLGSPVIFGDSASGAISYTGSGLYGTGPAGGFGYPQNADGGPANRYIAGTFSFTVDSLTPPAATYQAYKTNTSTGVQAYGGELGMEFRVTTSSGITIKQLGAFDHQGNGITGTQNGGIRVAIFNRDTKTIVPGLDTIIAGSTDPLVAGHRLRNITPVNLPAGNYVIVAKGYNAGELNGNSGFGSPAATGDNGGGAIAYTGTGLYGSDGAGFSYPQNPDGGPATRYLAGTFTYTVGSSMIAAANKRLSNPVATLVNNSTAASTHQAYTASTSTGVQSYGGELGMEFRVNNPAGILINQLGAFNHQGNGIMGSIRVAIFNKASRSIVSGLDAAISGAGDAYALNHRLKNITPVTLLPGDYVVVAKGYNMNELNGNAGFGTPPAGVDSAGGAITYTGVGLYGSEGAGFNYPLNADGGPATRYLAGTFVYSVVAGAGSRTVMITASDKKGNTTTATAQVTVKDTLGACSSSSVASAPLQRATADVESISSIRVYPNPARDRFTLQLSGMKGARGTIEVLDINGRVLEQRVVSGKTGSQTQVFSLSAQPPGVYFVRIRSEEGVKTLKVIVAR